MYHRCGLLPPGGMSFCPSLFPDSEGGQRSYGIKWLRAPATNEIDRLGQPRAVEHFSPLCGSGGAIEASPALLHRRHRDRFEDLAEDAIRARRILLQEVAKLIQARPDLHGTDLQRFDGRVAGQDLQACVTHRRSDRIGAPWEGVVRAMRRRAWLTTGLMSATLRSPCRSCDHRACMGQRGYTVRTTME